MTRKQFWLLVLVSFLAVVAGLVYAGSTMYTYELGCPPNTAECL